MHFTTSRKGLQVLWKLFHIEGAKFFKIGQLKKLYLEQDQVAILVNTTR